VSGVLVLFLMTGLGVVGFLDDFIKISKQRSLGLRSRPKLIAQSFVAIAFAVLALQFPNESFRTPASTQISFIRDTGIDLAFAGAALGTLLFVIWAYLMIAATSNGVNVTDGLDGLATGASVAVLGAYVLIGTWQSNNACEYRPGPQCYEVRDPRDLAVVAAAAMGACFGFLWWNASPAKIFMGDTGSLALGGLIGVVAFMIHQPFTLVIIGGVFVMELLSVVFQVGWFKWTKRRTGSGQRLFLMAPIHHHFQKRGWPETKVVLRFWVLSLGFGLAGLATLKLR
jgi:phospho-N-acetylmuramoyl-pentapeptide-transferase